MAVKKRIFLAALAITFLIVGSFLALNYFLNSEREKALSQRMDSFVGNYEEMQTLLLMSDSFGEEATCSAMGSMLSSMNKELWQLGVKIDSYRQATAQFMEDPLYIEQKENFNRKEVLYFVMFDNMKKQCEINQTVVSFFYRKKELCPDCDAQSFVISDIRRDLENQDKKDDLAIFSFDADLGLPPIEVLIGYYNITSYPCMVIDEKAYCGLYSKDQLTSLLCNETGSSLCN